jgi:hypothetical protein
MLSLPDVDHAIAAWRGPERDVADFFSNHVGFECKTTLRRLRHQISHAQANRPKGDHEVYIVSQWVSMDPGSGRSLPDLIDQLTDRTQDRAPLERQLLMAGYDRRQRQSYVRHFVPLEPPMLFGLEAVPRITACDPGIEAIRYEFWFDEKVALPPHAVSRSMARFGGHL